MAEITATNPTTGERITLVNGRWVPAGPRATQDNREDPTLKAERDRLRSAGQLAQLGRSFNQANVAQGSGGIGSVLGSGWGPIPQLDRRPERMRMEGLTAEMTAAARIPGSGDMSEKEMMMNMQRFPNIMTPGPVNTQRVNSLLENERVQRARVAAMERWAASHPSLAGFEEEWAPQEAQLRQRRPTAFGRGPRKAPADGVVDLGVIR
jgi:hypothetical protein